VISASISDGTHPLGGDDVTACGHVRPMDGLAVQHHGVKSVGVAGDAPDGEIDRLPRPGTHHQHASASAGAHQAADRVQHPAQVHSVLPAASKRLQRHGLTGFRSAPIGTVG
jgi:hypothetical protein